MRKFHVKKGDTVKVITGEFKGREAKIAAILPLKERVVLEGVSSGRMRTLRKTRKSPGGMVERSVSVHMSNVKRIEQTSPVSKDTGKAKKAKKENVKDA
jgi:large subunit ribosomal protein L24